MTDNTSQMYSSETDLKSEEVSEQRYKQFGKDVAVQDGALGT